MEDSYFNAFYAHGRMEMTNILYKHPEKSFLVVPDEMKNYFLRLLGSSYIEEHFLGLLTVSTIEASDEERSLMVAVPDDRDFAHISIKIFKENPKAHCKLLVFPRYGTAFQHVISESGIEDRISVQEFYFDLLPLEPYSYVVPTHDCFRRVFLEDDNESLYAVARALTKIEMAAGMFPKVITVGDAAKKVAHLMQETKSQVSYSAFKEIPTYSSLIVIDRTTDILTPLMTQFTYGAVLDENMDAAAGLLHLPDTVPNKDRDIELSDKDLVFKDIRNKPLLQAADTIKDNLDEIQKTQDDLKKGMDLKTLKKESIKAKHLADIKPLMSLHLCLMSDLIALVAQQKDYNEAISFELQTILGQDPEPALAMRILESGKRYDEAIRLLGIASLVKKGLPEAFINGIRNKLAIKFGIDILEDLDNLDKLGLLSRLQGGFFTKQLQWKTVANEFKLVAPDRDNEESFKDFCNNDLGSFYDGYVPLSVRLVQYLHGKIFYSQKTKIIEELNIPIDITTNDKLQLFSQTNEVKKVMIFIIGGITSGEIALFREIGKQIYQGNVEFHVGSTNILTGSRLINEICPTIRRKSQNKKH